MKKLLSLAVLLIFITPNVSFAYTQQDFASLLVRFQKILSEFAALNAKSNLAAVNSTFTCEAVGTGKCYYISNKVGKGTGTFDDPFGMGDLADKNDQYCRSVGTAINALNPGDILYFRGGSYLFDTCTNGDYYFRGYVSPLRSGTPSQPITFKAYPGEIVSVNTIGTQPAFGTEGPQGGRDYIRFMGFTVLSGSMDLRGTTGSEMSYNDITGKNKPGNTDTNVALHIQDAYSSWVHHNDIHGSQGFGENNAGIQVFRGTDLIVEDNYIHDNVADIYDKESAARNTYRRNFLTRSQSPFWGNNQLAQAKPPLASYNIYENVIDGIVELHYLNDGDEVHDNLIRGNTLTGSWAGQTWNSKVWNNVVIGTGGNIRGYYEDTSNFVTAEPTPHLRYMDYNIYTAEPKYSFGIYSPSRIADTFTQSQMQGFGFEQSSKIVNSSDIYVDQVSYQLKAPYTSSGRYGDPVGPDNVSQILDLKRYGPRNTSGVIVSPAPAPSPVPAPAPTPAPHVNPVVPTHSTDTTVSLSITPTLVSLGNSATITWSSTNATNCIASNGWSGTKTTSGGQSVNPIKTTTFTLSCNNVSTSGTLTVVDNTTTPVVTVPVVTVPVVTQPVDHAVVVEPVKTIVNPAKPVYTLTQTLRRGSRGTQVTTLQTILNNLGLLVDAPTGYFGVNTENAVKAFQRSKGIVSSGTAWSTGYGVVGVKTRAALLTAVGQ